MAMKLNAFFTGPGWVEVSIPDWFKERADALIKELGDDHADVQLFKEILAAGQITEDAAVRADELAGTTQNSDVFLLAIDIASHAFSVMQMVTHVPLSDKKAA